MKINDGLVSSLITVRFFVSRFRTMIKLYIIIRYKITAMQLLNRLSLKITISLAGVGLIALALIVLTPSSAPAPTNSTATSTSKSVSESAGSEATAAQSRALRLGGKASRWYEIALPDTWAWQRSTFTRTSTYGVYGTPYFDEHFSASVGDQSTLALVVQSNMRDEVTPMFPWNPPYCLTAVEITYANTMLPAMVYSDLKPGEKVEFGPGESCPTSAVLSFADRHVVELRICVDSTGAVSIPVLENAYNVCPTGSNPWDADYLRATLSCQGPAWVGVAGRQSCASLLQKLINSLNQGT
jgi:hypothetical protein